MRRRFLNNKLKCDKSSYFTIEALEDGLTVKLSQNASEYRVDNNNWMSLAADVETQSVNTGQKIQFRINEPTISLSYGIGTFTISKKCNISGNIMSLLFGDNFEGQNDLTGKNYAFYKLFNSCTNIVNASELVLPATALASSCYGFMFQGCKSLITAPELPATTLVDNCYQYMFRNCNNLSVAPKLPATALANNCYNSMFSSCTSLTAAPELPATELASSCYYGMFKGCTALKNAPKLPATTLVNSCYYGMFENCTILTETPELPVTTLASYCYTTMFRGCKNLNYITMLATDISASYCLNYWVSSVSSSGTFVKHPDMNSLPTGSSGIPNGWEVINR